MGKRTMNKIIRTNLDQEARLVSFAVQVINIVNEMPDTKPARQLAGQIVRSGTSAALNYAEAQGG
jgi:four helix bundle protein